MKQSFESGQRPRRIRCPLMACSLFAAGLSAGGAEVPTNSPPTERLMAGKVVAIIYLPDAITGFYRGTRFDRGSMIKSFHCDGSECFTEWRHPNTHPEINSGAGPSEEFDFGLDGATTPQGYDEAKVGEAFLKIGVGWLKKEKDQPYQPFFPFVVVDAGNWMAERVDAASIRIVQTTDPARKYAYRLTRTITVKDDPPRLIVARTLANTGSAPIRTSHYCHNFIRLNGQPIGPGYHLTLPFLAAWATSAPAGWSLHDNRLSFAEPLQGPVGTPLAGVKRGETRNAFTVTDAKSGVQLQCDGDRPLAAFTVFADATTLCPEPFVAFSLAPGGTVNWTSTYQSARLMTEAGTTVTSQNGPFSEVDGPR
jgi:hypothetical protein